MALKHLTEKAREWMPMNWGKRAVRVHERPGPSLPGPANEVSRVFDTFFTDFHRLLGDAWPAPLTEPFGGVGAGSLRVDLEETDRDYRITAEVPGLDADDIEVTLGDRCVIIRGTRSDEHEESGKNYHLKEIRTGAFYRSIPLPRVVDRDRVEAFCKNGQLQLRLPKADSAVETVKKIEVK